VLCRTGAQAEAALRELRALLADLGLELADAKTRLVCVNEDGEGFDFLGFHHRMVDSFSKPGFRYLARWPSARATQAARQRIRELTDRRRLLLPVEGVVADLNRFLTGWAGYFRRGNSTVQFHKVDLYVADRLARWLGKRHQARRPLAYGRWLLRQQRFLGLRPLVGRVHHGTRMRPGEGCRRAV
jgi:Group II intron, maturase-specific domain